jgi:hypothetical protein
VSDIEDGFALPNDVCDIAWYRGYGERLSFRSQDLHRINRHRAARR